MVVARVEVVTRAFSSTATFGVAVVAASEREDEYDTDADQQHSQRRPEQPMVATTVIAAGGHTVLRIDVVVGHVRAPLPWSESRQRVPTTTRGRTPTAVARPPLRAARRASRTTSTSITACSGMPARALEVEVGLEERVERLTDAVGAERARLVERLARRELLHLAAERGDRVGAACAPPGRRGAGCAGSTR